MIGSGNNWRGAVSALLLGALMFTACGDDADDESSGSTPTTEASGQQGASTTAASEPEEVAPLRVSLGNNGIDVLNTVAAELGFFEDHGVDVSIQCCPNATMGNDLVAGSTDIALTAAGLGVNLVQTGQDVSIIYAYNGLTFAGMLAGSPELTDVADLQALDSCRIASFPAGTGSFAMAQYFNEELQLDCELLNLGDPAAITAALASGEADAIVLNAGSVAPLVESGQASLLVDTRDPAVVEEFGGDAVGVVSLGIPENLEEKRESVVRYLAALADAREFVQTTEPSEIAEAIQGNEAYAGLTVDQLTAIVTNVITYLDSVGDEGRVSENDWALSLERFEFLGIPGFDPAGEALSYDAIVDMSFYDEAAG